MHAGIEHKSENKLDNQQKLQQESQQDTRQEERRTPQRERERERERLEQNKLSKRVMREAGRAIADFNMIEAGDRVMVCLSGGKDSYSMLDILMTLRERAPIDFDIIAVNLDQKQPGFPAHILPEYLTKLGVPFHIETRDTYSIVKRLIPEGKTTCSLCSRLRRGILYRVATELGATKIALGHHRDDILGTFFLNMFYGAKLKAMPPKLVSDDGRHTVIRPLAYVPEADLIDYAQWKQFPIIPCDLCGSQENLKRKEVSRMLQEWDKKYPGRAWNVFKALGDVTPSHLMDRALFDFVGLKPDGEINPQGDTAFDPVSVDDTQARAEKSSGLSASDPTDPSGSSIASDPSSEAKSSSARAFPSWTIHVDSH